GLVLTCVRRLAPELTRRRVPAGRSRLGHGSVGCPVLCVVEVVEFPHRGVSAGEHLGEHGAGHSLIGFGVELRRDRVHDLAPGPEGPAVAVCAAAQNAVEGVRVRVHPAGQGESGNHLGACGRGVDAGLDLAERTRVIAGEQDTISDGSLDPGSFAPELSAHRTPPLPDAGPDAAPLESPGTSISSSRARTPASCREPEGGSSACGSSEAKRELRSAVKCVVGEYDSWETSTRTPVSSACEAARRLIASSTCSTTASLGWRMSSQKLMAEA